MTYDDELLQVLHGAWSSPFTTRSNFAREHPEHIARASCLGFISTKQPAGWGTRWHITAAGLRFLEGHTPC